MAATGDERPPGAGTRSSGARARRVDPEVRREQLLRATIICLARLGPNGATGREICRQAGVSHSLLRHHFGNPQTLLLEAYEQLCDRFIARLEQDLSASDTDPWLALDRLFSLHFSGEWAGSDVLGAWIAFWTLVRARNDFAEIRNAFNERLLTLLSRILSSLPPPGDGLSVGDVAAIIGGVMDGLWLEFGLAPTKMSPSRAIALCNETARRVMDGAPRSARA